jgi:glycosyltransferase involved in cell wall biosynthesis
MLKVASFTGEINDPSSRYRVRQYIDTLKKYDIYIDDFISLEGKYPPKEKDKRIKWGIKSVLERLEQLINVNRNDYDCVILQREMISTLNTFENFVRGPRILDIDDAIYLLRKGNFVKRIAQKSDAVICGNTHLAEVFSKWNNQVSIVPTAVDTCKYIPNVNDNNEKEKITMGWVGTSGGFNYLYKIEKALNYILKKYNNVELLVVSDTTPQFSFIDNYRFEMWSEEKEVENFQSIDIGLMPLIDDEWSRGKCSYKMLLYMSCESAVVVSPVGMNLEVLNKGKVGFGAEDYYTDWIESIEYLLKNGTKRIEMAKHGRQVTLENYSLDILSEKMNNIIKETVR